MTKKRPVLKFLKKIFGNPVVRGTLKSFPLGGLAYEIAANIQHAKNPDKARDPFPHSPMSILAQTVFLGLIIYAFLTHQITIDDLLKFIGPNDFKFIGAPDSVTISDTLVNG